MIELRKHDLEEKSTSLLIRFFTVALLLTFGFWALFIATR